MLPKAGHSSCNEFDRVLDQPDMKAISIHLDEGVRAVSHDCGLAYSDVRSFFLEDLRSTLVPLSAVLAAGFPIGRLDSFGIHTDFLAARIQMIKLFLMNTFTDPWILAQIRASGQEEFDEIRFQSLSADSHSRATKPILVYCRDVGLVIKFRDSSPADILRDVLVLLDTRFSSGLSVQYIGKHPHNSCYIMPNIAHRGTLQGKDDEREFARNLGLLLSVAYTLQMTDIHIENLMVLGKIPVIVDPECMFYFHGELVGGDRMISTGLVGPTAATSSMRGGAIALFNNDPVLLNGSLVYRSMAGKFSNLPGTRGGDTFEATKHSKEIIRSFLDGCLFLHENFDIVLNACLRYLRVGSRWRHLIRKTRHYQAIINALQLPIVDGSDAWRKDILDRFRASGGFEKNIPASVVESEIHHMIVGDYPYFWTDGVRGGLDCELRRHALPIPSPRERVKTILRPMASNSFGADVEALRRFLSGDGTYQGGDI